MGTKKANKRIDAAQVALDAAAAALVVAGRAYTLTVNYGESERFSEAWTLLALARAIVPSDFHVRADRHRDNSAETIHVPSGTTTPTKQGEAGTFCAWSLPGLAYDARVPIDREFAAGGPAQVREAAEGADFDLAGECAEGEFRRLVCVAALARDTDPPLGWPKLYRTVQRTDTHPS